MTAEIPSISENKNEKLQNQNEYNIDNLEMFDVEDTLQTFHMPRRAGGIEPGWMLMGEGTRTINGTEVPFGLFQKIITVDGEEKLASKPASIEAVKNVDRLERERKRALRSQAAPLLGETSLGAISETQPTPLVPESSRSISPYSDVSEYALTPAQAKAVRAEYARLKEQEPKQPYYEKLFSPVVLPEANVSGGDGYDILLNGTDEQIESWQKAQKEYDESTRKEREFYTRFVTPESRQESRNKLSYAVRTDEKLSELLQEKLGNEVFSVEGVDKLRSDPELRYSVGMYFIDKLEKLIKAKPDIFGYRILSNSNKRPNVAYIPIPTMSSRNYVARLALSMLDGSFSDKQADTASGPGEHRTAAYNLLNGAEMD